MKAKTGFLGIDTSAYTTSVAVVDHNGACLSDARRLLAVKSGERGLRQSEAFFQHVNQLPELLAQALTDAGRPTLTGIAVSTAPRDVEGSYMPVFQAGVRLAESLSIALGIPLYRTTHQDGHLMAGCQSHPELLSRPFLAVHLSGGTTEILVCRFVGTGFEAELVGGSKDLSFGQLIDRVGVRLGLPFPAGKAMEALIRVAAPQAQVRRGGNIKMVPAREIVPGDILLLETGDKVAADARLITEANLKVNEATLTGESMPVDKHTKSLPGELPIAEQKNMLFMGTSVTYGRATAVVVKTGMQTEMGRIASSIQATRA